MPLLFQYAILLAVAAVSGDDVNDVIMSLSYEGNNDYIIDFKFTSKVFQSLYQCMCASNTSRCNITYDYNHVMNRVTTDSTAVPFLPPCKHYTCTNSLQAFNVTCSALQQTDSCSRQPNPSFIGLNLASSCAASCVVIVWSLSKEGIHFNDPKLQDRQCRGECCSGQATETPPPQNLSSTDHVLIPEAFKAGIYKETYIVAGIGAGFILIAIVVIVIFLFLKPGSTSSTGQNDVGNTSQSSTNGTNHNFFLKTTAVKDTKNAGRDAHRNSQPANPFEGFVLPSATHNPGREHTNNATVDVRNRPADNSNDNGSTTRGADLFKSKSKTPTGFHDEVSDSNTSDHNFEGDYAEIDDYHVQDCNPVEYIQDSSETDLNDGYSSVDNSDYYNINDTSNTVDGKSMESRERSADLSIPREGSLSTDSTTGRGTTGQQISDIPGPNQSVSEYFVARPVSSEIPAYSMGQLMDGAVNDLKITLGQEQDSHSSIETADKKRISYFILEKETEEEDI